MALHNDFPSLFHDHQFSFNTIPSNVRATLLTGHATDTGVFSILIMNPNTAAIRLRLGIQTVEDNAATVVWFFDENIPIDAGNAVNVPAVEGLRSHPKLMTSPNGDRYLALNAGHRLVAEAASSPTNPLRVLVTAFNYNRS